MEKKNSYDKKIKESTSKMIRDMTKISGSRLKK